VSNAELFWKGHEDKFSVPVVLDSYEEFKRTINTPHLLCLVLKKAHLGQAANTTLQH